MAGSAETTIRVRPAAAADVPLILTLIRELAEYERLADRVVATEERLHTHLFGERPAAEALIGEVDGRPAGFALFYTSFSTFLARPGIWLEDVFVREEHRGAGLGRALLAELARMRSSAAMAGSSGGCSTGTSPQRASTARSALRRWMPGRCSACEWWLSFCMEGRSGALIRRSGPSVDERDPSSHQLRSPPVVLGKFALERGALIVAARSPKLGRPLMRDSRSLVAVSQLQVAPSSLSLSLPSRPESA